MWGFVYPGCAFEGGKERAWEDYCSVPRCGCPGFHWMSGRGGRGAFQYGSCCLQRKTPWTYDKDLSSELRRILRDEAILSGTGYGTEYPFSWGDDSVRPKDS